MKTTLKCSIIATFMLVLSASLIGQTSDAGSNRSGGVLPEQQQFATAPNRWMLAPVDIGQQVDPVAPSERQARDRYWDREIRATAPLTDPAAEPGYRGIPPQSLPYDKQFMPAELIGRVWLTGTFEDFRVYLSASALSIYTEIAFRVSRVIGGSPTPALQAGALISIDRPGGTVRISSERILRYEVIPRPYDFSPGHTYLLGLTHVAEGDFYVFDDAVGPRWDLADGTAKADSRREAHRPSVGSWGPWVTGLPTQSAIDLLTQRIKQVSPPEQ